MDPMVVWLGWLALFLLYELYAAISKPKGDTLSEGVWRWFGVKAGRAARRFSPLRRVVLAAFMLALTAHFVFGWSVVPVIVTGAFVLAVIVYSTFFERVPLLVLALLAPPLLGAKACGPSCADLTKALEAAKASGNASAIAAAGWALAEAGCPIVVEPPPATCADGLPPFEGKCPTVCAELACEYGCDQTPSGAVCKAKPEEPQDCPSAPQGALVCDGPQQCGCWACSGRTGYVWTEMPECPPPCPAAPSCPAGEHAEVQSPGNPCTVYTGRCVPDAPPLPDPSPVCPPEGATCGCWHRPPGEEWQQLPPCPPPQPTCPATCPAGQACTDPAVGCVKDPTPPGPPEAPLIRDEELAVVMCGNVPCESSPSQMWPETSKAINRWRALHPERWNAAGTCLSAGPAGIDDAFLGISSELLRVKIVAGQSIAANLKRSDCTFVNRPGTQLYEEGHLFDYARACVATGPGAMKKLYERSGTGPPPPVEPPPVEPPPPVGACPSAMVAAINDPAARQMVAKPAACKRCFDSTPRVCDHPEAAIIAGRPGQRCVPLGPDESAIRVACETLFLGGPTPQWRATMSLEPDPPLAWQVKAFGAGRLRACDRHGVTCSTWLDVQ